MFKLSASYGLIGGAFLLLLFYASTLVKIDPFINVIHLFFDAALLGIFISIASLDFKRRMSESVFHLWQGMTIGFGVYLVSTIIFISGLASLMYFQGDVVINYQEAATNFLEERKELYVEEFGESGYLKQLKAIQSVTGFDLLRTMTTKKLVTGFLITPVIAIILRKKPN